MFDYINTKVAVWHITDICNYDCFYCFGHQKGIDDSKKITSQLISALLKENTNWNIHLVGGEVFLIPEFIEICKEIIENGFTISIETNLSLTKEITTFANYFRSTDVSCIWISSHILEREKRNSLHQFISNYKLLKNKGFKMVVNYVLHPSLFDRFEDDYNYLKTFEIELIPKMFKGKYNGKLYPLGYSYEEKVRMLKFNPYISYSSLFNSSSIICKAGEDLIKIDKNGDIFRCEGGMKLGDIFKGFILNLNETPCHNNYCPCWGASLNLIDEISLNKIKNSFLFCNE